MPTKEAKETSRKERHDVRQFSIFLENRVGAFLEIVKGLHERKIEIVALSVQDSVDSSVTRMVVSDPEEIESFFEEEDIAHSSCNVLVVELKEVSDLAKLLSGILMAEVNLNFGYPMLTRPRGRAALVVHVEDPDYAANVLESQGFALLTQSDISR